MMLYARKSTDGDKILDLLKRHCEAEENFLKLFDQKEIKLTSISSQLNILKQVRQESLQFIKGEKSESSEEISEPEEYIIIKEKEFTPELINSFSQAKNEIASVYNCIEKDNTPVLNLNVIKEFIANFSQLISSHTIISYPNININGIVITLSTVENSPLIILKNGRKAIITTKNYDFTNFNYDELIEILRFFDILISDTSYDHVRTEIVKQINTISSVSIIKT